MSEFADDLATWYTMQDQLSKLKAQEITLRKKLFGQAFPDPKEGTNKKDLDDGWVLKGTHSLNRKVDIAALNVLGEELVENKISVAALVDYDPKLKISEYRTLTAEQQKVFDQCLIITPGSPSMEIVLPKAQAKRRLK